MYERWRFRRHLICLKMLKIRTFVFYDFVFSSFGFVSIITRTHHNAQRPPILISDFLRQMRHRWNRHQTYIMNIVFLNNLVQK